MNLTGTIMRFAKLITGLVLLGVSVVFGCESLTRSDGTTVRVLTPAATQTANVAKQTADIVAVTSPGSPAGLIASIVSGILSTLIVVDQMRRKSDAGTLAESVRGLNDTLLKAGLVKPDNQLIQPPNTPVPPPGS